MAKSRLKVDLTTSLLHLKLRNPTILASGILGTSGVYFSNLEQCGVGAVTMKSVSIEPREGYKNPVIVADKHYILNAVGLPHPGIEGGIALVKDAKKHSTVPIIGSVFGKTLEQFGEAAQLLSQAQPDILEVDLSCPHVDYGKPIASSPELVTKVTSLVRDSVPRSIPVSIKLSPNVVDIKEIAQAAEQAGADALTAVNAAGTGMRINVETKTPVLCNKFGGVTGPALLPIALRCVYQIYDTVDIPIIGTGGVTYGTDALEMLMAGASAVGVGSAVYYRGNTVFKDICSEMKAWMQQHGYTKISQLVGVAHE